MSNLFTAVSVEQQEIVSGGLVVPNIQIGESAQFAGARLLYQSTTVANGAGAGTTTNYDYTTVNSAVNKTGFQTFVNFPNI
jgi:hypothetical protein